MVKCTNLGCLKEYNEEDNSDASCVYHDGKAIFHEFKKGWTCCNQIVYDWDDFQKLKGCRVGRHTNKPKENNVNDLWKNKFDAPSNENTNTNNNIVKSETKEVIKDIGEYEREQQRIKEEKAKEAENKPLEPLKDKEGRLYCSNSGCKDKVYKEEENHNTACNYHSGKANFHDLRKYWICCNKETWDWDEFMKIPTCVVGKHCPKYKK